MSGLEIRRQGYRSSIRKTQIQESFRKKRMQLLQIMNIVSVDQALTMQQLDQLYNQMEINNYSTESMLQFIKTVKRRSNRSLNMPKLFDRLRYVLQYMQERQQYEMARKMVSQLLTRIIAYAIESPNFLDSCFKELHCLMQVNTFQFKQVWPILALVRNPIFYRASLDSFIHHIKSYPTDIDEIVSCMMETFMNYTQIDPDNPQLKFDVNQYKQITDMLKTIFVHYQLGNLDMERALKTITNILATLNNFDQTLAVIGAGDFIKQFIEILHKKMNKQAYIEQQQVKSLIMMVGIFCGTSSLDNFKDIMNKNPEIVTKLIQMLPLHRPIGKMPYPRPVKWTHLNTELTIGTLATLSNLAAFKIINYSLIDQVLPLVIELSAYENSKVKEEVAIFLWNISLTDIELISEILCEHGILYAIDTLIESTQSIESVKRSLMVLQKVVTSVSSEKLNGVWSFNKYVVKATLQRFGTIPKIQQLVICNVKAISETAVRILENLD